MSIRDRVWQKYAIAKCAICDVCLDYTQFYCTRLVEAKLNELDNLRITCYTCNQAVDDCGIENYKTTNIEYLAQSHKNKKLIVKLLTFRRDRVIAHIELAKSILDLTIDELQHASYFAQLSYRLAIIPAFRQFYNNRANSFTNSFTNVLPLLTEFIDYVQIVRADLTKYDKKIITNSVIARWSKHYDDIKMLQSGLIEIKKFDIFILESKIKDHKYKPIIIELLMRLEVDIQQVK